MLIEIKYLHKKHYVTLYLSISVLLIINITKKSNKFLVF